MKFIFHIIKEVANSYLTWVLLSIFLTLAAISIFTHFTYWTRKGIKQKWAYPFGDDLTKKIIQKQTFGDMVMDIYNRFIGTGCVGFYQFHKPILMIKDPKLIDTVCEKNFFFFRNHTNLVPPCCDPLWNKTIFALKGQNWSNARKHLNFFLSGELQWNLIEVTKSYACDFTNSLVQVRINVFEADFKELFAKCVTEIMARSVFDLKNKTYTKMDSTFYRNMRESTENFGTETLIKALLGQTFPCIGKLWKARVFSKNLSTFFNDISSRIMRHRENFGIEKPDLISLLMNVRKIDMNRQILNTVAEEEPGSEATVEDVERNMLLAGIDLTEETIVSQAMTFFYFGFDIISTVLCFLFYELANNPSIQEKLIRELDSSRVIGHSFDNLFELPYLSMVITETLRKWPPFYFTERYCNKTLNLENERHVKISHGDSVWIPIWAIHRDPKYWRNPEVFDPERFSPENNNERCPNTFIPFGIGPRSCPGSNMAIMQIKIITSEILTIFEIVPTRKTTKNVVLNHRTFNLSPKGGLWLGLKKRFM